MKKDILIITDYRNYLRQGLKRYEGLDLEAIKKTFKNENYDVTILSYDDIINKNSIVNIKNYLIIYTSSQELEYKSYIDDILYELKRENTLIPRYEVFKAHENKSYQELYKQHCGINSLKTYHFASFKDILNYKDCLSYPVVLKKLCGAGSNHVYKVNSFEGIKKIIKKINKRDNYFKFNLKKVIKKFILKKKYNKFYYKEDQYIGRYILQEFVPNLDGDWKILIFGDKYYALNRRVRENDFRASGSGNFSFEKPPIQVLNYAKKCFEKLNVPFLSLDICINEDRKCYLLEYQGTHFGPYTLNFSDDYYVNRGNEWSKVNKKSNLSEEYANAILFYIKRNKMNL